MLKTPLNILNAEIRNRKWRTKFMDAQTSTKVSLLVEGYPRNGFTVFSHFIRGDEGVCITRLHPEYVAEKYGIKNARFHWLSGVKQQGTLSPKNISVLVKQVRAEIKGGRRKFFLDGLEYLLLWNDMNRIVSSLKDIEGLLQEVGGDMLVCIDPLTLEEKDLRKLRECFPQVTVDISEGSQQTCADEPVGKGQIDADLLGSKVLIATP